MLSNPLMEYIALESLVFMKKTLITAQRTVLCAVIM